VARAAELESEIVAQEKATQAGRGRSRVPEPLDTSARARNASPLAVRAAEEYGYVTRDVRRIITVGGLMAGILMVFVVLIDILHVITL
jgi:hypothetical protein